MDLHFYGACPVYWPLKALYNTCPFTHAHTHSYTDGRGSQSRCQLFIRSIQLGEPGIRTSYPIARQPALPPELQPPLCTVCCTLDPYYPVFNKQIGLGHSLNTMATCAVSAINRLNRALPAQPAVHKQACNHGNRGSQIAKMSHSK